MALTLADLVATHGDPVPAFASDATPPVAVPVKDTNGRTLRYVAAKPTFRTGAPAAPAAARPPTANQRKFLTDLFAQRAGNPEAEAVRADINAALAAGTLDFRTVSRAIDALKAIPGHLGHGTPVAPATPATAPRGGAWANIPDGYYATSSATGNNDLDFWAVYTNDEEGDWKGFRGVARVIGGKSDAAVKGQARRAALEAITGAPGLFPGLSTAAAAMLYGQEIGRCTRCNRHLTDEESRAAAMGPICRTKGWS